jgi:hypothetical protein
MTLRLVNALLDLVHRLVEAVLVGLRMRTDPAIAILPMVAEHEQLVDFDQVPLRPSTMRGDCVDGNGIDRVGDDVFRVVERPSRRTGSTSAAARWAPDVATRRATILPALRLPWPWWFVLRRLRS